MSNWGIPYMGSKADIIPSIAMNLPKAKHFYDLFGGGFSVTHYMLENKKNKYQHFHYNEIKTDIVELIRQSINGDFNNEKFKPDWVSGDKFREYKDCDAYTRLIWSFGNNQRTYLYSEEIEPYKKSMHMAIVFDLFDNLSLAVFGFDIWPTYAKTIKQKRLYLRQKIEFFRKTKIPKILHQFIDEKQLQRLQRLQQLEQLERLQQLQQLQQLEQLEQLELTSKDYREVDILPESIVYCDIPYRGTNDYQNSFDHKQFYDWAASRNFPVYISEYDVPDNRLKLVYEIDKRAMYTTKKNIHVKNEKLYWNGV